jgi:hypothetical protein
MAAREQRHYLAWDAQVATREPSARPSLRDSRGMEASPKTNRWQLASVEASMPLTWGRQRSILPIVHRGRDPRAPTEIRAGATSAEKLASDELGALLSVISEDVSHVRIRIAAAVGFAAVFVTQIPLHDLQGLPNLGQWLTIVGVILLLGAAASLFQYTQQLNKLRLKLVADQFPPGKSEVVDSWCERFYRRPGWAEANVWFFWVGMGLLVAGTVCVAIVLVWLVVFQ